MSSQSNRWKWKGGSRRGRGRQATPTNIDGTTAPSFLDTKPREEKNFKEFYPDLDEERHLKVFITGNETLHANDSEDGNDHINNGVTQNLKRPIFKKISAAVDTTNHGKMNKTLISLGYKSTEETHKANLNDVYIRPDPSINTLTNNTLTRNDKFQVMYDMDEQDAAFMDLINEKYNCNLPYELLEVTFTFLEREWYLLEKILPPKKKSLDSMNSDEMIDKATQHTSIYGSDDGSGGKPEEDQCCAVCNDSECDNANAIVFCDGCDIAVHQECYGVIFIPEGQWLCRRCLISRNNKSPCLFCPSTTGAFKQTENGSWCHVICALWINELYFANPIYMEPVEGLDLIPKSRWRLNCYICRQKVGACIQCSNRNCFQAYHVTCARRSELYMHTKNGTQYALSNPSALVSYCDKHGPSNHNQSHDVKTGIEKTRLYFATVGAIKDKGNELASSRTIKIHKNKESPFRWKSELDTPIAPELFSRKLQEFLKANHMAVDQAINYRLCSYWSLKREHKRGAALIKRLDTAQYGMLNSQEIDERLLFLDTLTADVDRLCELSSKVSERTSIQNKLVSFKMSSMNLVYFPVNYIIEQLLERITRYMDSNRGLSSLEIKLEPGSLTFREICQKNETYGYKTVSDFIKDFKKVTDALHLMRSTQAASVKKSYTRWQKEAGYRYKAALALESEIKELMARDHNVDLADLLSKDVFEVSGIEVDLQTWKGPEIAEDLTDVEEVGDVF